MEKWARSYKQTESRLKQTPHSLADGEDDLVDNEDAATDTATAASDETTARQNPYTGLEEWGIVVEEISSDEAEELAGEQRGETANLFDFVGGGRHTRVPRLMRVSSTSFCLPPGMRMKKRLL